MNTDISRDNLIRKIINIDKNDYYEILNSDLTASRNELKSNYKKLIIQLHPDKNIISSSDNKPTPEGKQTKVENIEEMAKEAFLRVNKAYQILKNDKFRDIYNKFGRDPSIIIKREKLMHEMKSNPEKIMLNKPHLTFHSLDLNGDILQFLLSNISARDSNAVSEDSNYDHGSESSCDKFVKTHEGTIPKFIVYQNVPIILNSSQINNKQKLKDFCTVLLPLLIIFLVPIIEIYIFD